MIVCGSSSCRSYCIINILGVVVVALVKVIVLEVVGVFVIAVGVQ